MVLYRISPRFWHLSYCKCEFLRKHDIHDNKWNCICWKRWTWQYWWMESRSYWLPKQLFIRYHHFQTSIWPKLVFGSILRRKHTYFEKWKCKQWCWWSVHQNTYSLGLVYTWFAKDLNRKSLSETRIQVIFHTLHCLHLWACSTSNLVQLEKTWRPYYRRLHRWT